ncbi:MAG: sensor histidine kinase response regulator, Cache 1, and sensory box, partial [Nitrospirae bacterium]|nr:sensor histidine kinase response regulator, Cache 1, and sensory box [Nitrospirota bacterium]
MAESPKKRWTLRTKKYILLLILGWSVLMFVSLSWNWQVTHDNNIEKARLIARSFYDLTIEFRRWGTLHGGVYVPITDTLQPNPYLTVAERDITTTTGRKLTLVNPAWMTRQVFELISKRSALPIISHLTSLNYVNPVNRPDAWEETALKEFERGVKELSSETTLSDEPYMRIMRPFMTEEACLKCHGHQGYKVGDIRGGISISVPLRPHFEAEAKEQKTLLMSHTLLWLIGTGGIMLFSRNIQRHQRHIVESEEKYRILFESNPHPMWVYDIETYRFLTVNDAAVNHYGYTRDEFLSMTIKDIRPAEDVSPLMENVSRVTTGMDKAGVWRHRKKDGSLIYVEITSHTVDFGGRRAEIVLANDVTDSLKLEDQLRHSQKMEAVGLLAGGVAHDFNNVLTAIIGYGNLLQMKLAPTDPLRAYAESILTTSQRAAQLTQSLLTFSRKQVVNPLPLELNGIIMRVEKLLKRLIREDIELRTELTHGNTTVLADSIQVEQMLMNLVTNARDAMPRGGTLTISSVITDLDADFVTAYGYGQPGPYVRLTVADTGAGMDERTRERIFDPFFTTKEMGKGTGLGLATVYGIVKQHRGFIDVESAPGAGTSFHIYFPLSRVDSTRSAAARARELKGGSETVLVAEDDEVIRNLTRSVLTEFGYQVIVAKDGEEAVSLFGENRDRTDLLLLDVIMPRKNGRDAY